MSSSSKDRGSSGKDDCQIHVDKEGESCVIKIESVGQEKMLKELLARVNSLKGELDRSLVGGQKQQTGSRDMVDAIQSMTGKLQPLEDRLEKVTKYVGDDHAQLTRLHADVNRRFDEIKQDLTSYNEQQKATVASKETLNKILQKLENLGKTTADRRTAGKSGPLQINF